MSDDRPILLNMSAEDHDYMSVPADDRAAFEWWMSRSVPRDHVDSALAKYKEHSPSITDRDVACLTILEIESTHLRHLIPDAQPEQDRFAMLRAFVVVYDAYFSDRSPEALYEDFARWAEKIIALRSVNNRSPNEREALVLRLFDNVIVRGRIDPKRLERELTWSTQSAKARYKSTRRVVSAPDEELLTALHTVAEIGLEGDDPWCKLRAGRYDVDKRRVRDMVQRDYKPSVPPRHTGPLLKQQEPPNENGPPVPVPPTAGNGLDIDTIIGRDDPWANAERIELFRELRAILDEIRDCPQAMAAFGYLSENIDLFFEDSEFPEFANRRHHSQHAAAAAWMVSRDALRHQLPLLKERLRTVLEKRGA